MFDRAVTVGAGCLQALTTALTFRT